MDASRAAELRVLLKGVPLPASKDELLEHAVRQRAEPHFLEALRSLPEREYASLDEVGERLVHVQPSTPPQSPAQPPGGDDYT